MNCLVIADAFPSPREPWRGPYNRRQVEGLATLCKVLVVNPLPWTWLLKRRGHSDCAAGAGPVAGVAMQLHPVFLHLPLVGRSLAWRSVLAATERALREADPPAIDVVLATFAYPHGLAARQLAKRLGVPYAIKVRGSDLHSLPPAGKRRHLTAQALRGAAAVVAVSRSLARIACELGADAESVHVLPNGVDTEGFPLIDRTDARCRLGLSEDGGLVLFVGNLVPVKGLDVLLEALRLDARSGGAAQQYSVAIAGSGPLRRWLARRIAAGGLGGRVRVLGELGRQEVALWMNAADALVLPSRNEGCPNVVLEALSCGTPVVASRVGAVPELINGTCGIQVEPGDAEGLATGLRSCLSGGWDRQAIRLRVKDMSWQANAEKLFSILRNIVYGREVETRLGVAKAD